MASSSETGVTGGRSKGVSQKRARKTRERQIAHAVNHPVRMDALLILFERTASPKEIAKILQQPLGTVSFHVDELKTDGAIELVTTRQRRGAVEHYYRAKLRPEIDAEDWRTLPLAMRRKLAGLTLQAIVADGLASLRHRKLEVDDDLYLVWIPMELSEAGESEVTELQAEILERLEEIKERDEQRRAGSSLEAGPVRIAATMWFERGTPKDRRAWRSAEAPDLGPDL